MEPMVLVYPCLYWGGPVDWLAAAFPLTRVRVSPLEPLKTLARRCTLKRKRCRTGQQAEQDSSSKHRSKTNLWQPIGSKKRGPCSFPAQVDREQDQAAAGRTIGRLERALGARK